jgi:hypothetical protein
MLSTIVANILFAVAGSSWQADGLSLLPGAVLMAAPIGVLIARLLIHVTEPPLGVPYRPSTGPFPLLTTDPTPTTDRRADGLGLLATNDPAEVAEPATS